MSTPSSQSAGRTRDSRVAVARRHYQRGRELLDMGKSVRASRHFHMSAAGSNNPDAAFQLGMMYESGTGVRADVRDAIRWYRMAASWGRADAHNRVTALTEELESHWTFDDYNFVSDDEYTAAERYV